MSILNTAVPSSLRKPVENSRVLHGLSVPAAKPFLVGKSESRAAVLAAAELKSRFVRMPQESEDARITGSTRSLERRLLALNLGGYRTVKSKLGPPAA